MKTIRPSARQAATILRNAAKVIETYGWRRGVMGNKKLGFCALGSIDHVQPVYNKSRSLAEKALRTIIGVSSIADWNDAFASGAKEVTSAMLKVARELEHGLVV